MTRLAFDRIAVFVEIKAFVAKTFQGLEEILAKELTDLGAQNVTAGRRMVAFEGDKELMYKANLCCRTALRILMPAASTSLMGASVCATR